MGLNKTSGGYNPSKQNKIKDLSKEYGVDISIVKRIAMQNNYNIMFVIDELENINEKNNL